MSPFTATFRFYEELNDFLPPHRRKVRFPATFDDSPSVKDTIESLGVPHTEIDVILVNGLSIDFSYRLHDGDDIAVYPVFESLDVTNVTRLRPAPLRTAAFICDVHLGRVARILRILGFDTLYHNDYSDHEIVTIASSDHRIVLTRDRGLLKHSAVTHGYCVRSTEWREQTHEIIERFDLRKAAAPFTRCAVCNGIIARVEKNEIIGLLEDQTKQCYEAFSRCRSCGKIYWEGSHFVKLRELVGELINQKKE
jgi:uncharacterized protein with PIN domain